MIDFVGKRYGVLPSELVKSGDTLDLQAATVAVGYEEWLRKNPGKSNKHSFNQQQLQEMLDSVKNKNTKPRQTPSQT